jgi:hypothetical protein
VAAEANLVGGSKPAEPEAAVRLGAEEGGFGERHLGGHVLQPGVRSLGGEQADGRRIAGEGGVGESVDLVDGTGHGGSGSRGMRNPARNVGGVGVITIV